MALLVTERTFEVFPPSPADLGRFSHPPWAWHLHTCFTPVHSPRRASWILLGPLLRSTTVVHSGAIRCLSRDTALRPPLPTGGPVPPLRFLTASTASSDDRAQVYCILLTDLGSAPFQSRVDSSPKARDGHGTFPESGYPPKKSPRRPSSRVTARRPLLTLASTPPSTPTESAAKTLHIPRVFGAAPGEPVAVPRTLLPANRQSRTRDPPHVSAGSRYHPHKAGASMHRVVRLPERLAARRHTLAEASVHRTLDTAETASTPSSPR